MTRLITFIIFVFFIWTVPTSGQTDSTCYAIKVVQNGKTFVERKNMNEFSKKGFYIYKNYCYSLDFTDNVKVFGKVVDIKNDSLYITNSLNFATAKKRNINYDTLKYSIKQIKTLRLITGEIDGYSKNIDLQNYSRQLVKTECCDGTSKVIYREDPQIYTKKDTLVQSKKTNVTVTTLKTKKGNEAMTDCYPYLVNDGIVYIYENEGLIYIVNSWAPGK